MGLSICLLALLLGCNVTAGILHEIAEEKTSATLRCPLSVKGKVTWSRESHGNKVDILTTGDGDTRHNDPYKRYSSLADKSLFIRTVTISDSGRYLCNNEPAVELTVIPSGTIRRNATDGANITLTCLHDVGGSGFIWSRGSGDVQQEKGFYVSPVDNTLLISAVQRSDSGLYYCNGKPAVYLTVIKGATPSTPETTSTTTSTPTTTCTTTLTARPTPKTRQTSAATPPKTAAPPPATTVPSAPPLRTATSTDTTTKKKKRNNTKNEKNKGKKRGSKTSSLTTTTTTTTTETYEPTSEDHQQHLPLVCGVVVSFLVAIILVIISIYCTRRRKLKRQGNEEIGHVYDEIQDGFVLRPINAGSNQNDPTYSKIQDFPPVQEKTDTSLPMESPYSLIGDTFTDGNNKGSSELSDNTYFLLEKPKAPRNNKDQCL